MAFPPFALLSKLYAKVTTTFESIKKHAYSNVSQNSGNITLTIPIAQYGYFFMFFTFDLVFSKIIGNS